MILTDIAEDRQYAFTVSEIVPYSIGLTAYMDIEEMRELFGESEDFVERAFHRKWEAVFGNDQE